MKILGGIITYGPDIERLAENIMAVITQVDLLYIFDNGSQNIEAIENLIKSYGSGIVLHRNYENAGVAYALRCMTEYADKNGFAWILTLDQDSVIKEGLVKEYLKYLAYPCVGGMTCMIKDRITGEWEDLCETSKTQEVAGCITSGFFLNIKAYSRTSGYDVRLFIDGVDYDICNALRRAGYKLIKIPFWGLVHELGNSRIIKIGSKKIVIYGHPAFRKYYISRNAVYLAKKYKDFYSLGIQIWYRVKDMGKILFFEKDKLHKIAKSCAGIADGLKMKIGD